MTVSVPDCQSKPARHGRNPLGAAASKACECASTGIALVCALSPCVFPRNVHESQSEDWVPWEEEKDDEATGMGQARSPHTEVDDGRLTAPACAGLGLWTAINVLQSIHFPGIVDATHFRQIPLPRKTNSRGKLNHDTPYIVKKDGQTSLDGQRADYERCMALHASIHTVIPSANFTKVGSTFPSTSLTCADCMHRRQKGGAKQWPSLRPPTIQPIPALHQVSQSCR